MSEHTVGMTKTTPLQVVIATLGGLIAPLIAIYMIFNLVMHIQKGHLNTPDPKLTAEAVAERIKPVGEVTIVDASAPKVEKTGEQVFNAVCTACHTPGAMGAPKYGNKADWAPRIAQGYKTLIDHALHGYKGKMPARGGDPDLTDLEVERAVAYMADAAGAKFTPPEPAAAPAAKGDAKAAPAAK